MNNIFWFSVAFIFYTYFLYPVGVWVLGRFRKINPPESVSFDVCPSVTFVIAVHNEERRIEEKVKNIRSLDYPQEKIDIIFVSDGSTDGTDAAVQRQERVQLLSYHPRKGKAAALNFAMESRSLNQLIVFCDVRQKISPGALRLVVSRVLQSGVGLVSGELIHFDPHTHAAANIGLYWRYEKWIRKSESNWSSVVGATGAFYIMRREAFVPLAPDTILDDFEIPMQVARQGLRVQIEDGAHVWDELQEDIEGERKRKMRTLGGNFQSFSRNAWLFSPWSNPIFIQFLSHKVFRLIIPYAMAAAFFSSAFSQDVAIRFAFLLQFAFYLMAIAAKKSKWLSRGRLANFAAVFCELNWIAFLAGIEFLKRKNEIKWEKT